MDISQQLVEAVISDTPDHKEGTRPVHAIGIGVDGYFQASLAAPRYCIAQHFQGQKVRVNVRFSNGSGSPVEHDGWSDVRGMATRFHLKDDAPTDLIAMTLGEFFTPTVEDFLNFTKAARAKPVKRQSPWAKLWDMLQLKVPLADPPKGQKMSGDAGLLAYADRHRFAQLAVADAGSIGAPTSYARAAYHAVHTFVVEAPDGQRRNVRFSWQPVAGVRKTDPEAPPVDKYLHAEMRKRLERWPARFVLQMMIGETGDNLADPTRPWPKKRIKVNMGTLYLTGVADDQAAAAEHIAFNPCRLAPGIELSEDPILAARKGAYEFSRKLRGGTACPFHGENNQ